MDLGDPPLNQRAVLLGKRLVPAACENWAETAAAYRFPRNEQGSWDDVIKDGWRFRS